MFRPCIDLHEGRVKQIVGGTLSDQNEQLRTNFVSEKPSAWFAELYKRDGLRGGHVIMLGPGNERAGVEALRAYPGGLQIGGGIDGENGRAYLDAGATHLILTSWVFKDGAIRWDRLSELRERYGRSRVVLDLSCRKRASDYFVVTDRWQKFTTYRVRGEALRELAEFCDEYLVHAVDVEGLCAGMDWELIKLLSQESPIPTTYAGGARSLADLEEITRVTEGRVDLTIGSALDIFGGSGAKYSEAVLFNQRAAPNKKRL